MKRIIGQTALFLSCFCVDCSELTKLPQSLSFIDETKTLYDGGKMLLHHLHVPITESTTAAELISGFKKISEEGKLLMLNLYDWGGAAVVCFCFRSSSDGSCEELRFGDFTPISELEKGFAGLKHGSVLYEIIFIKKENPEPYKGAAKSIFDEISSQSSDSWLECGANFD
ncbi:MAG: hypothetical protein LBB63_01060 [Holosporaceae bacterium]|jgi:hypothetical protein|nr:hypothetical protein [Holosporaceae bacterium]